MGLFIISIVSICSGIFLWKSLKDLKEKTLRLDKAKKTLEYAQKIKTKIKKFRSRFR